MPATTKALYEEKGKLWKRATEINDKALAEKRAFTAEEQTEWDTVNTRLNEVTAAIKRTKSLAKLGRDRDDEDEERRIGRDDRRNKGGKRHKRQTREELRELAFAGWARAQLERPLTRDQKRACQEIGLNPRCQRMTAKLCGTRDFRKAQNEVRGVHPNHIVRALSAVNMATGGSLVPATFVNALEVNMLTWSGMLQEAEVIRTARGGEMQWPTADDASNEGSQVGESVSVDSGETDPSFGVQIWNAYKIKSGAIKVPFELLEDAAFDLAEVLGGMIGERLGRALNRKCTLGIGSGTFEGLVYGAAVGKTASATTSFTTDEVLDFIHSVDPAYRLDAKLMMHDSITLVLRKFKEDDSDQYMWQPGLKDGVPDRFLGYEIAINQHMASSVAATNRIMTFGRHRQYKVRMVNGTRFYRLTERYRDNDQDGFLAFLRGDGRLLRASSTNTAVKVFKLADA